MSPQPVIGWIRKIEHAQRFPLPIRWGEGQGEGSVQLNRYGSVFAHLICIKALHSSVNNTIPMSERPLIDLDQDKILSLARETQFAPNGIVSRTLMKTPTSRVVLFGFAAGQELCEHTSTFHALIQILSGECEFSLAGKPHLVKAGDMLYMPPNLPHAVKATQQVSMLLTLFKPAEISVTKPPPIKVRATTKRFSLQPAG